MPVELRKIPQAFLLVLALSSCADNVDNTNQTQSADLNSSTYQVWPAVAENAAIEAQAYRLLLQASFGPTPESLEQVSELGIDKWVEQQLNAPSAYDDRQDGHKTHLQRTISIAQAVEPTTRWYSSAVFNQFGSANVLKYQMAAWWENALGLHPEHSLHGSDQLRQRVAFALSQILVASPGEFPLLKRRGEAQAYYYDLLARNAFGNFRTLLGEVARSPAMGIYLSHHGNRKADLEKGTRPDENFAREIMQLFSIGLYQLNLDGSPDRDANPETYPDAGDKLVNTYSQRDVEELAKIMTGWDMTDNPVFGNDNVNHGNLVRPMEFNPTWHEDEIAEGGDGYVVLLGERLALNAGVDGSALNQTLDLLFRHPNVGPFISHQLIMRLVTSNPSPDYISRVARVFNDNGSGVRGDLKAVTRAILLDEEARAPAYTGIAHYGKVKEPLLAWSQLLRAFGAVPLDNWRSPDNTAVKGVYWHPRPEAHLLQAPMRSPSVFNFYNPDFIPGAAYFSNNKVVSPELQIQTEHMLLRYSNLVEMLLTEMEKNSIRTHRSLANHASQYDHNDHLALLINFDRELAVFELALDGDRNGDFANMHAFDRQGVPYREQAIDALLVHLDRLLLGHTMTPQYHAALREYLLRGEDLMDADDKMSALNLVKNAVRMLVTSSTYILQK
ncbi:MAG: DUF1800 domain-containing protein [Thiolinea sp.]